MALGVTVKLEGLEPLLTRLDAVKRSVRNKYLRRGITKAVRFIRKDARARCPVDENSELEERSLLKKSLEVKVSVNEEKKTAYGIVGPARKMGKKVGTRKRKGKKSNIGDAIYQDPVKIAHLVEYGHGGPHPAAAHPFMRPAWDANKEAAQDIIAGELALGIGKEAAAGK